MTAVTALLALSLTGCSSDTDRVEENATVTVAQLGLSFVVPTGYRDADDAVVRAAVKAELTRSGTSAPKAPKGPKATKGPKKGATAAPTLEDLSQEMADAFKVFLVDPATVGDKSPDTVLAIAQPVPVTTGTGTVLKTGLEATKGIGTVDLLTQTTRAGQAVRASYAITIGKDADGDDLEVFFQTIELGVDATSSVQITTSSMDEDVARDLADTVVASISKA